MTAPRFTNCRCGHPKLSHELDLAPQCIAEGCTCLSYRPQTAPDRLNTLTVAAEPVRTADALIAEGRKAYSKRTVNLAQKIAGLLRDLSAQLDAERETAAARREIETLERKLAEAKARLRGDAAKPVGAMVDCPDCSKSVKAAGLGIHRAKAHKAVAS